MKSTVVNTSKEMMAFSDYPPPEHYPNFMHHSLVMEYIRNYSKHYGLDQYVQLNTEVKTVSLNGYFYKLTDLKVQRNSTSGWSVELKDGKVELFDKVMLCTGHHSIPKYPNYAGWCCFYLNNFIFLDMKHFKGRIIHAKEYTDFKGFEDKNIFLVGIGNSSLDIAVELTKVASSVTVSTRRGSWIFNRVAQVRFLFL